jgi:anti-anti-sigma factor
VNGRSAHDRRRRFRCTVRFPRSDVCVVRLGGELDMATVPVAAEYLRRQTAGRPRDLVLDLAGVTLLAAAGVTLLLTARDNVGGIHGRFHLTGVNRHVERMLRITGLLSAFDVHDDLRLLLGRLPEW